jgi:DNA-directed RNA polymerase subunit beta'
MFGRCEIIDAGDTRFTEGDVVPTHILMIENSKMEDQGLKVADYKKSILGISNVSLSTDSWISASSFQNTTRVLIRAATRGASDKLEGLKENVTVGRLIPAGTGFHTYDETLEGYQNDEIPVKEEVVEEKKEIEMVERNVEAE